MLGESLGNNGKLIVERSSEKEKIRERRPDLFCNCLSHLANHIFLLYQFLKLQKDQNEKKNTREQIRVFFFFWFTYSMPERRKYEPDKHYTCLYLILTEYDSNDGSWRQMNLTRIKKIPDRE